MAQRIVEVEGLDDARVILEALFGKRKQSQREVQTARMDTHDLSYEAERTYTFGANNFTANGKPQETVYTIKNPKRVWITKTVHRVLDANGNVHVVPAVGQFGCVVKYKPKNWRSPVMF